MNKKLFIKIIVGLFALTLTLPFLSSCGSVPNEKSIVGTVGEENVYYDEVYYLATNYKSDAIEKFGKGSNEARQEVDRLIKENITVNYARLALCEKMGLEYDDIKDSLDSEIEQSIEAEFDGDKEAFLEDLEKRGLTERYAEYVTGLDLLASRLEAKYVEKGLVPDTEAEIIKEIKKNIILVRSLTLYVDEGESADKSREQLEEAISLINNGQSLKTLMRSSKYNEDVSDTGSGYTLIKGGEFYISDEYEEAAFELEVNEVSGVIKSTAISPATGKEVECYFVIQRYELSDEYIDERYTELRADYINAAFINPDYQKELAKLKFEPNENYKELDLLALEAPTNNTTIIVIVVISVLVVCVVVIVITVIFIKKKHKKKNISAKKLTSGKKTEKK